MGYRPGMFGAGMPNKRSVLGCLLDRLLVFILKMGRGNSRGEMAGLGGPGSVFFSLSST